MTYTNEEELLAFKWIARAREELALNRWCGLTVICPIHLRPMGKTTIVPNTEACGCDRDFRFADLVRSHGLEAITSTFDIAFHARQRVD